MSPQDGVQEPETFEIGDGPQHESSLLGAAAALEEDLFSDDTADDSTAEEQDDSADEGEVEGDDDSAAEDEAEEEVDVEDSDDADSEDPDSESEPTLHKVKVRGEEIEVTYDELLGGYSRTADYTRDKQALAKEVKEFEGERTQLRDVRGQYAQRVTVLKEAMTKLIGDPPPEALRKSNPGEYAVRTQEYQGQRQALEQLETALTRAKEEGQREFERAQQTVLARESQALRKAIPEWVDPQVAQNEQAQLVETAMANGFTQEEVDGLTDHRLVLLLRKVRAHDEIAAKSKKVLKGKVKVTGPVKPGAKAPVQGKVPGKSGFTKQQVAQHKRLQKSGRLQDAAALVESML